MSANSKRVSPILLPGGPESARDAKDFRPRPGGPSPKGASAPVPADSEQKELTPADHPSTNEMPVEPPKEPEVPKMLGPELPAPVAPETPAPKPPRGKRTPGNVLS